jgi:asparagine synthase (glutamine-hydrolysing)
MCGFFGVLGDSNVNFDETLKSLKAINHRGPDDFGVWDDIDDKISLGHNRLSIVDLSSLGHQPMISSNKRYVIAYNGEIYNFLQVREELENSQIKINWYGKSDTEVLLEAVSCWGLEKTLNKINGMFGFALWDRIDKTLVLARDRMGEKPVYFGWQHEVFLFGSDLASFREHTCFENIIDRDALSLYMRHSYIPAPYSIYKNIQKLLPGHLLKIALGKKDLEIVKYWDEINVINNAKETPFLGDLKDSVSTLENLLINSVKNKMVADVPIGAFLSGGVDSSLIAALMQSQSNKPIKTFTIGFDDVKFNEAKYAKEVSEFLKTEHTEYYFTDNEILELVPLLNDVYSEPFADSSQLPTILVSRLAKNDVTVALTGDGGDELFCGYRTYSIAEKLENIRNSILPNQLFSLLSSQNFHKSFSSLEYFVRSSCGFNSELVLTQKLIKTAEVLGKNSREELYRSLISRWENPTDVVLNSSELDSFFTSKSKVLAKLNFKEYMMSVDTLTYLPDNNLCKVDRASMFSSLETRIPLLDQNIIQFAWSLPIETKFYNNETKWPLKQILYKYVPQKLIERPKMGFSVPLADWLRGPLREWAEELLSEKRLKEDGFFESSSIRKIWLEHLSLKFNWQHKIWNVLMFQSWLDNTRKKVAYEKDSSNRSIA